MKTGEVFGRRRRRHRAQEFPPSLRQLDRTVEREPGTGIHLVLDDHATHKTAAAKRWSARTPGHRLHFIPTGVPWLNQAERFFAGITGERLRRGVFRGVPQPERAIRDYVDGHDEEPKPFARTAGADPTLRRVEAVCKETPDPGHQCIVMRDPAGWYAVRPDPFDLRRTVMNKRYELNLTAEERSALAALTRRQNVAAGEHRKARALLPCDQSGDGPALRDVDVAGKVGAAVRSIESWRKRARGEGPPELLERRRRTVRPEPILDGEAEAKMLAIARSTPPEGRSRWSLRLLASRLVELEVVESVSHETVRRSLQKTTPNRTRSGSGARRRKSTRRSSRIWSGFWTSIDSLTTRPGRSCAWTSSPSS